MGLYKLNSFHVGFEPFTLPLFFVSWSLLCNIYLFLKAFILFFLCRADIWRFNCSVINMAMWQHYTVEIAVFKEGTKRLALQILLNIWFPLWVHAFAEFVPYLDCGILFCRSLYLSWITFIVELVHNNFFLYLYFIEKILFFTIYLCNRLLKRGQSQLLLQTLLKSLSRQQGGLLSVFNTLVLLR